MENQITEYKSLTGQDIKLSPAMVRKYLVNGGGNVSDQEIIMFLALCKFQKLNPFLREVYLIKYGTEKATMVTGKETFLKRAQKNPKYEGHETGISADGRVAWAKVYVKGYFVPIKCEVDYEEYVGRKKDGNINKMWKTKSRTMLKKVALVQALREAFAEDFGGMYSQEEITTIDILPVENVPEVEKETEPKPKPKPKNKRPIETTPSDRLTLEDVLTKIKESKALPHLTNIWKKYQPEIEEWPPTLKKAAITAKDDKKRELAGDPPLEKEPDLTEEIPTDTGAFTRTMDLVLTRIGKERFFKILGDFGFESIDEVMDKETQTKLYLELVKADRIFAINAH